MKKKPQLYRYEVNVPVAEYWVYNVIASSKTEALKKYHKNQDCKQNCTTAAPIGSTKILIYRMGKWKD